MLRDSDGFYQIASYSTKSYLANNGGDLELAGNADNSIVDYVDKFDRIHQLIDHSTYLPLATPIITDAQVTIVDENGIPQDYWHLYDGGQITTESETLPPMIQYRNLQDGENIFARTYPIKSNVLIYSTPISGDDQDYARRFVGRPLS
jgi:hypothetical protein